MIVDQINGSQSVSDNELKQARIADTLKQIGDPPKEISNPIYQDFWRLQQAWQIFCQQHASNGEWMQKERNFFPQIPAEELIMDTAMKLENNFQNVKALLEADQIKYCYVDHLVSILARILIRYACPPISEQDFPHLTQAERKEKKKNWKPLIDKSQVRALLKLCDLLSSCKQQISNHSLRDINKKEFIDIGFSYEDLLMIDNAYGTCFNLDTRGFDYRLEQKIAPLVLCPFELSNEATLYEQINGESLINCDLKFTVDQRAGKPPLRYVIPGDTVRSCNKSAKEFVKTLVEQKGFTKHMEKLALQQQKTDQGKSVTAKSLLSKLKRELQMKVIWVRYVTDRDKLKSAMRAYFQAAYLLETHGEGGAFSGRSRGHLFPKSFQDSSLFVHDYLEALKKYGEERPINRVIQIFMRRICLANSNVLQEVLKPFNVSQLRKENPRFVYDEDQAIDQIFIYQLTKQLSSVSLDIQFDANGKTLVKKYSCQDGPIHDATVLNTSLQEDLVSLITNFFQNISVPINRQHKVILGWEDIENKQQKLRQKMIASIRQIFFNPFVEIKDPSNGETHYYFKLHPKILLSLMFAFKQKWLYEEALVANENPNFRAMEKLIIDWIMIYNKSDNVYYLMESKCGENDMEVVKVNVEMKAQMINQLLEQIVKVSNDFRTGMARQFSQQLQSSQLIKLFESEILKLENTNQVNPFINSFTRIISELINQDISLVSRYLKVEKQPEIVLPQAVEEQKQEPVNIQEASVVNQENIQMQEEQKLQPENLGNIEESAWDEEGLLPKILNRYLTALPHHRDTAYNVIKLFSYISVTTNGQKLIESKGNALLTKALSFNVDNRLEFPQSELLLDKEFVVGQNQTSIQLKISADSMSNLVQRVPSIKQTLKKLVKDTIKLSKEQTEQLLTIHFSEMMKIERNENTFGYKMREKTAQSKVRETELYLSLHRKAQLLNALSQQQMHFEYMARANPINDVMQSVINTPEEIDEFLDLLELLVMKNSKLVTSKFENLLKTVFAEQELSIEKLKQLFKRIKKACTRLKDFIGKPLAEIYSIDEILNDNRNEQKGGLSFIPGLKVNRRLEFECLVSVLDFYAQVLTQMGHRQANKIGTYEKWDDVIETLFWIPTMYQTKQNQLILNAMKGNLNELPFLAKNPVILKLQQSLEPSIVSGDQVKLIQDLSSFNQNLQNAKTIFNAYLQDEYCISRSKLEDQRLLSIIWMTANQTMRSPERQNSVNEVIRCNLKSLGKVVAQMAKSLPKSYNDLSNTYKLLKETKQTDSLLNYLFKIVKQKAIKGTFLCQFVASDGLIALCYSYNALKALFIKLKTFSLGESKISDEDQLNLQLAAKFTLSNLMKNNQMLTPFFKLIKDNQAYANPQQHMEADTEPKNYKNIQHFFANHFNQMLQILTGFPDANQLKQVLNEHQKIPELCQSAVYGLLNELATGFSSIPQIAAPGRNPNQEDDPFRNAMLGVLGGDGFDMRNPIRNPFLDRVMSRQVIREPREPTQEEIAQVTSLGFSQLEADAALRMANFDIAQTLELLLTNIEEVFQYSTRVAREKEEEQKRKEQEEFEAAMKLSLGIGKKQEKLEEDKALKTISQKKFEKKTKEYMIDSFKVIVNSARQPDAPLSQQQTLIFVSQLIKQVPKEKQSEFLQMMFENLENSSSQLIQADEESKQENTEMVENVAIISAVQKQKILEIDLQLVLLLSRHFSMDLKKDGSKLNSLSIKIIKYAYHALVAHQSLYSSFSWTLGKEILKELNQQEKDLIQQEFCLSSILLNAQQLCLHIIFLQSTTSMKVVKNIIIQQQSLGSKIQSEKVEVEIQVKIPLEQSSQAEQEKNSQALQKSAEILDKEKLAEQTNELKEKISEQANDWIDIAQPEQLFDVISLLLGKNETGKYRIDKANLDTVLLLSIKLLNHGCWPEGFNDNHAIQNKALEIAILASQAAYPSVYQLLQHLLSIAVFNMEMSSKICEKMIVKSFLATAIYRHSLTLDASKAVQQKFKENVENQQTQFDLAKFLDQTQYLYNINPQNLTMSDSFKRPLLQLCDIVSVKKNNKVEGQFIRLKQDILDSTLAKERKQQPEFEKLILSAKVNEKQIQSLIKQAQDVVFDKNGTMMHKCIETVFEQLLPTKFDCLNDMLADTNKSLYLREFGNLEEAETFQEQFNETQAYIINLLDKAARFSQVYTCLSPQNTQVFIVTFLNSVQSLLWSIERKKEAKTIRFKVVSQKVEKTFQFLFKLLNNLTGFNRLMSHEEKLVKYDLRTKLIQQAVLNFSNACTFLSQKLQEQSEFNNPQQARIKAVCMLQVINALISDTSPQQNNYALNGIESFKSSIITLMFKSKAKIVKLIALLIKNSAFETTSKESLHSNTKIDQQSEVLYKIDTEVKIDFENDQEMSFFSISDSLQEADQKDDKDEELEEQQHEVEQLHGFLISQSIACLSAICNFIDEEKQAFNLSRKEKKKSSFAVNEDKHAVQQQSEEQKMEVDQVIRDSNNVIIQVSDEMHLVQQDSQNSNLIEIIEQRDAVGAQFSSGSGSQEDDDEEEESDLDEDDGHNPLNQIGDQYVEDEYDAEDSEEDGDENEDMEDDEDDYDDEDELAALAGRNAGRANRENEAAHDIINAPVNEQVEDQIQVPVWDIGLQHRGMRHVPNVVVSNENWTNEERQVQRTLAMLQGLRLNQQSVPRALQRPGGMNPFLAPPNFGQNREGQRIREREQLLFGNEPAQNQRVNAEKNQLSSLFTVFTPIDSKSFFDIIKQTRITFNERRKKFKDNQQEEKIAKAIKDMRENSSTFEGRSRSALLDQFSEADRGLLRGLPPAIFQMNLQGNEGDGESWLQRYERLQIERMRLINMAEAIPERFGEEFDNLRQEQGADDLGASQFQQDHARTLEGIARDPSQNVLMQAVFRDAEVSNNIIVQQEDIDQQQRIDPQQQEIRQQMEALNQSLQNQVIQSPNEQRQQQRSSSIGSDSDSDSLSVSNGQQQQPQMLPLGLEIPDLSSIGNGQSNSLIVIENPRIINVANQGTAQNQIVQQQPNLAQIGEQDQNNNQTKQIQEEQKVEEIPGEQVPVSTFEEIAGNFPVSSFEQIVQQESIQVQQQPAEQVQQLAQEEPMTFGIPNAILIAHDIDPDILHELPEEMRVELLSTIQWQPAAQQQQNVPEEQKNQNIEEPRPAQQQPEYGNESELDPVFLASLPPAIRQELLDDERNRRLQASSVQRQAEEMDLASLIATAATPQLRAEMLANLGEEQIRTLPEGLRAEANAAQQAIRRRRDDQRHQIERMFEEAQARGGRGGRGAGMVRRPPGPGRDRAEHLLNELMGMREGEDDALQRRFEQILENRQREREENGRLNTDFKIEKALEHFCGLPGIFEDQISIEQSVLQMEQQIAQEDLIIEGIVQLLLKQATISSKDVNSLENQQILGIDPNSEDANACKLIQFIQLMTIIKSPKGELKLINKLVNAITLLLKLEINQESYLRQNLFADGSLDIKNQQSGLISLPDALMTDSQQIPSSSQANKNEVMIDTTSCPVIDLDNVIQTESKKYSPQSMTIILTFIGVMRLVAKNKLFVTHMLKSLLYREDYFSKKGTSVLQKQQEYLKAHNQEIQPPMAEILSCLEQLKNTQKSLNQEDLDIQISCNPERQQEEQRYRQELSEKKLQIKTLNRNLQLLVQDTFIEFDQPLSEVLNHKDDQKKISKQTVTCLAQILDLQIVDRNLLNSIGNVLLYLSQKSNENWQLVHEQCQNRGIEALRTINRDLKSVEIDLLQGRKSAFMSNNVTPSKAILEESKNKLSLQEEALQNGIQLIKQSSQVSNDLNRGDSVQDDFGDLYKLDANQESQLRKILVDQQDQLLALKHIFQLFNLIFREINTKFKEEEKEEKKDEKKPLNTFESEAKKTSYQQVLKQIKDFYHSKEMYEHIRVVNITLKVASATKIDLIDFMSGNLSCIFGAYMPDLQQMIEDSEKNKIKLKLSSEGKENITIKPLDFKPEVNKVLTLFKNIDKVDDRLQEFGIFCLNNKKSINQYLQSKQRTFSDFSINDIVNYMPNILNFENKRAYFKKQIDVMKRSAPHEGIDLTIKRGEIFMDAYAQLNYRRGDIKGKLHVRFDGEGGVDAGGVSRDFYIELSRQMFNPNYSLFKLTDNGVSHYFNTQSYINPDHLHYLKFIGRMVGKALLDGHFMDCYFAKPLYKMILGEDLTFKDLEDLDNEYYKSLNWSIEEDVTDIEQYFSVTKDFFGKREELELIPNGRSIKVTNENKLKWIEKRVHFFLYGQVSDQIDAFLSGFHELIPKELIRIFDYKELELLISGLPNFDLDDLKKHTVLEGFTNQSPQIIWFWETLAAMDSSEIGLFLQFVTGCSKIPLEGFKALQGMRGVQHFTIMRKRIAGNDFMRLPQGHTCYNQLDLPEYPSKEILQERIHFAIKETKEIVMT